LAISSFIGTNTGKGSSQSDITGSSRQIHDWGWRGMVLVVWEIRIFGRSGSLCLCRKQ